MFSRGIDNALRASEQRLEASRKASDARHDELVKKLAEDRRRLAREVAEHREGLDADRRRWEEEMEQRYRDEVQITREFMRRNELVTKRLVERIEGLAADRKAHTKALLHVLDRMQNGGGTATAE